MKDSTGLRSRCDREDNTPDAAHHAWRITFPDGRSVKTRGRKPHGRKLLVTDAGVLIVIGDRRVPVYAVRTWTECKTLK